MCERRDVDEAAEQGGSLQMYDSGGSWGGRCRCDVEPGGRSG